MNMSKLSVNKVVFVFTLLFLIFTTGGVLPKAAAEVLPTDPAYDVRYGENKPVAGNFSREFAVKCVNGTFVGKEIDGVLEFKGIPFVAEQPTGKNRWKAPVPYKADDGIYEAFYFGRHPLQNMSKSRDYVEGEDCLHLNVFKIHDGAVIKKPVMVWIYGGGFQVGGTADPYYDGHNFIKDNQNVILVTINYRLGPYGFLHLSHLEGGEEYPDAQNLGLLDQRMALRWVKENIDAFGGDADNITIFGESAGGASAMLHAISKESQKYFKRAISASGPLSFTNSTEQMIEFTDKLMSDTGCKTIADLQNADPRTLVTLYSYNSLAIFPERDGRAVPLNPYKALEDGAAKDIDLMLGCTSNETYTFVCGFGGEKNFGLGYGPRVKRLLDGCTSEESKLAYEYLNKINGTLGIKMNEFSNQVMFYGPFKRMINAQAKAGGKMLAYYWTAPSLQLGQPVAGHGADVPIVLNNAVSLGLEPERTRFDHAVQCLWINFASRGNPSLVADDTLDGNTYLLWEPFTAKNKFIMGIDRTGFINQYDEVVRKTEDSLLSLTDYYMF